MGVLGEEECKRREERETALLCLWKEFLGDSDSKCRKGIAADAYGQARGPLFCEAAEETRVKCA